MKINGKTNCCPSLSEPDDAPIAANKVPQKKQPIIKNRIKTKFN